MDMKDLLERLCGAHGTPGEEKEAAEAAAQALSPYAKVYIDHMGNVVGEMGGEAAPRHVLLDAHIDQIGMVVTAVDKKGFLKIAPCGGVDRRILPGTRVRVLGREVLPGVVCCTPPHLQSGREDKIPPVEEMAVDVGRGREEAIALVSPGDRVVFCEEPKALLGGRFSAVALDDRAGVASLIRCAELLSKEETLPCRVTFLFSSREETGGNGAKTGAYAVNAQEAVMVDVSFARFPGLPEEKTGALGEGPMIGYAASLTREISVTLQSLAQKHGIPCQTEAMGGSTGTNADEVGVARRGVRTGLLSIPLRNMHTPAEIIQLDDIENTAQLLRAYVMEGGGVHA